MPAGGEPHTGVTGTSLAVSAGAGTDGVAADALLEPWFACLGDRLGALRLFDCHTQLGCADPDSSCFDLEEPGALAAVDARAVVFSLAERGSYRAANDPRAAADR